ncbi:MAG: putative DNA binding domain-containing protein [Myxococcales bacterium]|nr:putative DNA binding domain-containing protein [Myxococcales bacterium]
MLTEAELLALTSDLESDHVERKATLSSKADVEAAICAFANDLPGSGRTGVFIIGVDDKTGLPVNTPITDQLLLSLSSIRSDGNILPFPTMSVYKATLSGIDVAVVEVAPSHEPPVRLRGVVRVRVGPRRAIATRDDERILTERRRGWDLPFDQRPVSGASLDDLDLDYFRREYLPVAVSPEVLRENGRSVPEQLAALHLASPDGVVTVAGLLLLGFNPTTWIKGAYVQFLRIDGTELTDPILDRKEFAGPLPQVLRQMDDVSSAHIRVATTVTGSTVEQRRPDFPIDALQQLLRNAVIHRNYESSNAPVQWYWFADRVEIHNPGGLFGRATPTTFGRTGGNDYRNPALAAALYQLGFVQRFGLGVPLSRRACAQNGNPEPRFLFEPGNFAVVVGARQ